MIDFYASEPEVAHLRSVLLAGGAIDRVSVLVALVWQLRPRDKRHALRLADPDAAKDWRERGFDLARPARWPHMLGARHMLSGSLPYDLKEADRSCDALIEAIPFSGPNRTLRHPFLARAQLRPSDFIARIGGEEFTILPPDTGLEGGEIIANRIRVANSEGVIAHDGIKVSVTASFGVTAVYATKKGGRNLVRLDETARARRLSRGA